MFKPNTLSMRCQLPETKSSRGVGKDQLMTAVIQLREQLGLTQTDFAARLGRGMSTIQRWERVVPPAGAPLLELAKLAEEIGRPDLTSIFARAIEADIGLSANQMPVSAEEGRLVERVLLLFRNRHLPSVSAKLKKIDHYLSEGWDEISAADSSGKAVITADPKVRDAMKKLGEEHWGKK